MSANFSEILNVQNFFEEKFIVVPSDWVQACISFVKEEHGQNVSIQSLKDYVYQQWLSADLEEIGECVFGSICENLRCSQKTTLTGYYALQVDGIRDVGRPAYSQLKELEKDANSNAEFSAAPPDAQPPWEAKPTRMLMLNLTDGCSHVQGMEYKPINVLSPNLPPGLKVLVQGPVDCRFGVLLLTPEKIKILGGEVENKLEKFSRKALLREILQIPPEGNADEISDLPNSENPMEISNEYQPIQDSISNDSLRPQNQTNPLSNRQQNVSSNQNRIEPQTRNTDSRQASKNNHNLQQNSRNSSATSIPSIWQQNSGSSMQGNIPSRNQEQNQNTSSSLDDFEIEDDDFDRCVDPDMLDELEKESLNKSKNSDTPENDHDIWQEDEDMMQEMMAFQDENPGFELPTMGCEESPPSSKSFPNNKPYTYLASALKESSSNCTITIKGFIMTVLSKLECTIDKGWALMVKINDGTATLDASIHDKVLENIIGISAPTMVKMQAQAAEDPEKRRKVMEAISRCKVMLQELNCLMDIQFTTGAKPCLVKSYPVSPLHIQQLLERVRSKS